MAKQITIKDEAAYKVALTKSIRVGRSVVNPGPNTRLRGDLLKKLQADDPVAVASYEAV
ncbi:hypothetical protein [Nitrobacter hamburgensis]|uniref:hypothetical protein n=1 Tax=Nitrobacter hamburgensis TaxID=912 RepID=UPI00030D601E|nr:hypothetical protein [Nitrobacter hamburgensis]